MGIKNLEFFDGNCLDRTSVLDNYGEKEINHLLGRVTAYTW